MILYYIIVFYSFGDFRPKLKISALVIDMMSTTESKINFRRRNFGLEDERPRGLVDMSPFKTGPPTHSYYSELKLLVRKMNWQ